MRLLTVPETAEVLRVSRSKVYELIQTRELVTVRIGARRRVEPAALEAFIAARRGR